jgi:hypothetical protein
MHVDRKIYIDALKSGKFKQCRMALQDKHGAYCAIGLAGQLFCNNVFASHKLVGSVFLDAAERRSVMVWNDSSGMSFKEIAERLENAG